MKPLDKFGEFVIRNLWDAAILHHSKLEKGEWRAPSLLPLQNAFIALPPDTKRLIEQCVFSAIESAAHDFLFALQEAHDTDQGIAVLINGTNIAAVSDGLQGELFGENGWIAKYSKFKATAD